MFIKNFRSLNANLTLMVKVANFQTGPSPESLSLRHREVKFQGVQCWLFLNFRSLNADLTLKVKVQVTNFQTWESFVWSIHSFLSLKVKFQTVQYWKDLNINLRTLKAFLTWKVKVTGFWTRLKVKF